jgi:hypothetical protein
MTQLPWYESMFLRLWDVLVALKNNLLSRRKEGK